MRSMSPQYLEGNSLRIKNRNSIEIKKLRQQVEESERNMLRNMISIFSIFVAIFSFVVVGTNTALNISMEGYIDVGIVLGIIFLFLFGLLYITKCLFINK